MSDYTATLLIDDPIEITISLCEGCGNDAPSDSLLFTYFMDRDIAIDDDVQLILNFLSVGQTGYIDWGDGTIEQFDTEAGTTINTTHTFANSGLNEIKVYGTNPEQLSATYVISETNTTNGGTSLVFEDSTTGLLTVSVIGSSTTALPTNIPLTATAIAVQYSQIATADFTSFTNLQSAAITDSPLLTSVNITGLSSLENIGFAGNPLLTTIDITGCVALNYLTIHSNALDAGTLYTILGILDTNGVTDGGVECNGQTPAAPLLPAHPSITNLEGKGWTITYDT